MQICDTSRKKHPRPVMPISTAGRTSFPRSPLLERSTQTHPNYETSFSSTPPTRTVNPNSPKLCTTKTTANTCRRNSSDARSIRREKPVRPAISTAFGFKCTPNWCLTKHYIVQRRNTPHTRREYTSCRSSPDTHGRNNDLHAYMHMYMPMCVRSCEKQYKNIYQDMALKQPTPFAHTPHVVPQEARIIFCAVERARRCRC